MFLATPPWDLKPGETVPLKLQIRSRYGIRQLIWQGDTQILSLTPGAQANSEEGGTLIERHAHPGCQVVPARHPLFLRGCLFMPCSKRLIKVCRYLLKDMEPEDLLKALHQAAAGETGRAQAITGDCQWWWKITRGSVSPPMRSR
ncbi:hypothetical protein WP50_14380 [Lactiplantibacillus plantarum]|nr:hypothetical protein WP50_14380 [Lactiplantibacillus plantarum]